MKAFRVATLLLINLVFATSLRAQAEYSQEQLAAASSSEPSWTTTTALIDGFTNGVTVDLTNTGSVRLKSLPAAMQTTADLDVPSYKKFSPGFFGLLCSSSRQSFSILKTMGAVYKLKIHISPFSAATKMAADGNPFAAFENQPRVIAFHPSLILSKASVSFSETEINPAEFEALVSRQLATQKSSIDSDGIAVIDLTGWDDVACDLASGNAHLNIGLSTSWEPSRVYRRPVINAPDLQALYQGTGSNFKPQKNILTSNLIAAMSFGAAIVTQLKKSPKDFDLGDLFAIYSKLVDIGSGKLASLTASDFAPLAVSLDHLTRNLDVETPVIQSSVNVPTR